MKKSYTESLYLKESLVKHKIKICALIAMFLFVFIATTACTQNSSKDVQPEENMNIQEENSGINLGNDGVNAGIAKDEDDSGVEIVSQGKAPSGNMVAMSVEDYGRQDPFLPSSEQALVNINPVNKGRSGITYELLPPPEEITTDDTATEVIKTTVSGIMYDKYSPSAILKIDNSDYLVRTGDDVNGYKVLAINRDCVTVQHGANVYKAGVGELLTDEGVNFNNISNLEHKFGGNKRQR